MHFLRSKSTLDSPKRLFNAFRKKPSLGTPEGLRFTLPKLGKNPSLETLFVSRLPLKHNKFVNDARSPSRYESVLSRSSDAMIGSE